MNAFIINEANLKEVDTSKVNQAKIAESLISELGSISLGLTPAEQHARAVALQNALETVVEQTKAKMLQYIGVNSETLKPIAEGKHFVVDGLIFAHNVKLDYNYEANDDLDESEGPTLKDLLGRQENLKAISKTLTQEIKVRKEKIRYRHPNMRPIQSSIKHVITYIGTKEERAASGN